RAQVRDADIDGLCGVAGSASALVERYPVDSLVVCQIAVGIGWILYVVTRIWKARDLGPCNTGVGAAPEAVATRRTEIECAVAVWIDGKTFAWTTTRHVASEFVWQHQSLPRRAAIG